MVSTKQLVVLLAALLLCFGVAYAGAILTGQMFYPESATIAQGTTSLDELSKRFADLAEEKGAPYAYDVLRQADIMPGVDIHLIAHAIGHELYLQQGIDGMSICTQEFGNGCSHTLVIEVMQEMGDGEDVRSLIDDACHKAGDALSAYTMCYHGLGHGVFAFFGYSLPETVAFCTKMGTKEYNDIQAYECIGGAAMELLSGGGHDKEAWIAANKKYFTEDPLAPCNSDMIPDAARSKCYVYMSPHYMERAGANMEVFTDEQLAKGMSYCAPLPPGEDRNACIGGFGKDFVGLVIAHDLRIRDRGEMTDVQLHEVERLCNLAPTSSDANACHAFAVSMFFWGGHAEAELAPRYCNSLSDARAMNYCFTYLAGSISHMIADPKERVERCRAVPEKLVASCVAGQK